MTPLESWRGFVGREAHKPAVEWIIRDLINRGQGVSWLTGPTGIGKSNLLMQLAFSVASGQDFLHKFSVPKPRKVALVEFEVDEQMYAERMALMAQNFPYLEDDNLIVVKRPSMYIVGPYQALKLDEVTEILKSVDLAIFDPFNYMLWGSPNKPENAQSYMDAMIRLSRDTGTHILLGNNFDKFSIRFSTPGSTYSMRGPTEYHNMATTIMQLEWLRHRDSKGQYDGDNRNYSTLYFTKYRHARETPMPMNLKMYTGADHDDLIFKEAFLA